MEAFYYQDNQLMAERVPVHALAEQYGTPAYVYSRAHIETQWRAFDTAFGAHPHRMCYAVKANSNLAVLSVLAKLGSGFDIVSAGELERVLRAGGNPANVVFSGVGKTEAEMQRALELGIACFNVESEPELIRLNEVAGQLGVVAPISLRVNPDVNPETHPYISTGLKENKFGVDINAALDVYRRAAEMRHVRIDGVDCHIGSQLTTTTPFEDALDRVLALVDTLHHEGISVQHIDVGGGLGIRYRDQTPPSPAEYVTRLLQKFGQRSQTIVLEPGRAIVGNAGLLIARVEYLKLTEHRQFAIIDAAMNDLIRPALYDAWQEIVPVIRHADAPERIYDVVGPVCETGDFLGKQRALAVHVGDYLAVRSAGAYGFVMSSNYNTRPRACEIMVDGDKAHVVRKRESLDYLLELEETL
jgi:diaminopimelate decarboxylase